MSTIQKIVTTIAVVIFVFALLPGSPFTSLISNIDEIGVPLAWLNWFFPIGQVFSTLTVWCLAIGAYYLISWVLRQLGVMQ